MSTRFDGSRFVGLDDSGMSANGSGGRFWDTALDNAIASNNQYLCELGNVVTWKPRTKNAGDPDDGAGLRPITSVRETVFLLIPWLFSYEASSLELGLIARVADETGDNKGVLLNFKRYNAALTHVVRSASTNALPNSEGATPNFQDYKIVMTYPEPQLSDTVGAVVLSVQGQPSASAVDTTLGGGSNFRSTAYRADDVGFYDDSAATRPNADGLDTQMTRLSSDNNSVDHVYYPNNETDSAGDPLTDQLIGVLGPTVPVSNQLQRYGLSYMQVRGATLWQRYTDTQRPDRRMFAARKALLGEVALLHAIRLDSTHMRPRPLWIGPEGYKPNPEAPEWPEGYHYRFNRVYGDDTQDQTLLTAYIFPDTANPRIALMAYVAGLHLLPTAKIVQGAEAAALTPSIEWEHELRVTQLEDGDTSWAAAAARGSASTFITHAHTPFSEDSLLAMSEAYVRFPAVAGAAGEGYAFREGQLDFAKDKNRLQLVELIIPQITHDPATQRPLRLDWIVRTQTPPPPSGDFGDPWGAVPDLETAGTNARDLDTLALVVVGASIWELPQ
jgi:hypothetical protein